MIESEAHEIINEVYPKIVKYYGLSKFHNCPPFIELHHNIYVRITGEDIWGEITSEVECNPDAEYDRCDNEIIIYYPRMETKRHIIETLIHEYQHYLQSPSWMVRYYNMGYEYNNHPYEVAATKSESNWKTFA
tara:strand:+ start:2679 stop:3077 length:399 start_codon:yes stop_codon:yes gene_type:complete